jgi:hypothetical protein
MAENRITSTKTNRDEEIQLQKLPFRIGEVASNYIKLNKNKK